MTDETLAMLMNAHAAEIYRYLKYLGADHAMAEDLAQETFMAAYRSKKTPPRETAGPWLRTIARNRYFDFCRRRRHNIEISNPDLLEAAEAYWGNTYEGESGVRAASEALKGCLQQLPDRQREIVRLRYEMQVSRKDMALRLGIAPEGVKSALRRIRDALAACMEKRLREETP